MQRLIFFLSSFLVVVLDNCKRQLVGLVPLCFCSFRGESHRTTTESGPVRCGSWSRLAASACRFLVDPWVKPYYDGISKPIDYESDCRCADTDCNVYSHPFPFPTFSQAANNFVKVKHRAHFRGPRSPRQVSQFSTASLNDAAISSAASSFRRLMSSACKRPTSSQAGQLGGGCA